MEEAQIVPQIIDVVPADKITIAYENIDAIENGNDQKPGDLVKPPTEISWPVETPETLYTLNLADLDTAHTEKLQYKHCNHWTVMNIPGTDVAKGFVVTEYSGPKPPQGESKHRFLLTVFKQPDGPIYGVPVANDQPARHNFDVRHFANTYNLGQPVAALYFTAQPDEYSKQFWEKHYGSASGFAFSKGAGASASGTWSFKCNLL